MNDVVRLPELTPREETFVQEYIKDLNGKRAAMRSGVPETSAKVWASNTLNKVAVSHAVDVALADRSERIKFSQDQVLRELAVLALSDIDNYHINEAGHVTLAEGANPLAMRAIKKIRRRFRRDKDGNEFIDTEIELWDKPSALKMAGQHLGMFINRKEITGKDGGPIKTESRQIWEIGDRKLTF